MKYKLFGNTGLKVSEVSLGGMTIGDAWGWGADKKESLKMLETYAEAGGNFIDTANIYTNGQSEEIIGDFLKKQREQFVLATKFTLMTDKSNINAAGNNRKNIREALEASLKRLGTEYIDVYWLHAWDYLTPIDEVMRTLDDLVKQGKIFYIGISDTPAWVVSRANEYAKWHGLTPFSALQLQYSLILRDIEREFIPMANSLDLAITAWGALGSGFLTGKYTSKEKSAGEESKGRVHELGMGHDKDEKKIEIAAKVSEVANEVGCHPSHVALLWTTKKYELLFPIVGSRRNEQLKQNLEYLNYDLTPEQMQKLDDVSAIDLGFPHSFLQTDMVKNMVYGPFYDKIASHRS